MDRIREAVRELVGVFRSAPSKHEANRAAGPILEQLTRHPAFLTAVLEKYLTSRGVLDRRNYPVVGMEIASNPWFGLVANCWIPLPGRETHLSTKAIHHHGNMLLSTATLFGPGYEHWMFTPPKELDRERGLYEMDLLEAAPHPRHHVSFVDAWVAHTPFYPKELSITLALWSNRFDTTWRDHLKRLPGVSQNANLLRDVAVKMGMRKALDLKVVESYDFFPTAEGFQVMRERKEFELGPNEDHLHSVFHVVQRTGNEHLGRVIRRQLARGAGASARPTIERLLDDLERGRPTDGLLSWRHHGIPHAQ
ncbi:MAG: hypothetical protein KIS78_25630, partial [Labilithrix sp.]|nr:hypothetical protein [Labilithrix sp.]